MQLWHCCRRFDSADNLTSNDHDSGKTLESSEFSLCPPSFVFVPSLDRREERGIGKGCDKKFVRSNKGGADAKKSWRLMGKDRKY